MTDTSQPDAATKRVASTIDEAVAHSVAARPTAMALADALPRNPVAKVTKGELRAGWA